MTIAKRQIRPAELVRKVLNDLYHNFWSLLSYAVIFSIVGTALLTPLLSWAMRSMAFTRGRLSVSNGEIFSFVFSLQGLFFVSLVALRFVLILYLEHAGMILIAWNSFRGKRLTVLQALWAMSRRLPALALLGSFHVVSHVIFIVPFFVLGAVAYRFIMTSFSLYYLVMESTIFRWTGLSVAAALIAGILILHGLIYLHWVLALPALLLEGYSPGSALNRIRNLLRGTGVRIAAPVFLFWAVLLLLPVPMMYIFKMLGAGILSHLPADPQKVLTVIIVLMAGYLAVSFMGEFLTVAVSSLTITRLYDGLTSGHAGRVGLGQSSQPEPSHPGRRLLIYLLGASIIALAGAATILSDFELKDRVMITAHRGSSFRAPENTLSAVRAAIEDGADYIEIDVRLTKDGHVVLLHDRDLLRVAGVRKMVADITYNELKDLDVGSCFGPQFRDERIPLLSDVIALARDKIRLNIELKSGDNNTLLINRVVRVLEENDFVEQCIISSSNRKVLEAVKRLNTNIRTGYIVYQAIGQIAELDVDYLIVSMRMAKPSLIDAVHAVEKEVHVWTVNKPQQMIRLIDLGVDNLITDVPDVANALLEDRARMGDEELLLLKVRSWFLR